MERRGKLEIIRDILVSIQMNKNIIKPTPLKRKSNMSTKRFKEFYNEMINRGFIKEVIIEGKNKKYITLTNEGFRFLEKYNSIIDFIGKFEL